LIGGGSYLYDTWKQYYGKEAKVLIWRAGVSVMHPDIDPEIIQELMERDPIAMAAELNADWRDDISTYISDVVLRACMTARFEFPELTKYRYRAFLDSSGGKNDSMCLAVGRFENGKSIITRVEEAVPPFDPQEVVASFAGILKEHGVGRVTSDHYAGVWVSDSFIRHGIQVEMSDLSASQLYIECQALMNMGKVTLPADDEKTARQFLSLERRNRSGGQDAVNHPEGLHDDRANVCAGLAVVLQRERPWTEAEQSAHLPITSPNPIPYMPFRQWQKVEDLKEAEKELQEFCEGSKIVRRG